MDVGVATALIAAFASLAVGVWSAYVSRGAAREVEQLRHSNSELERLRGATGALRLQLFLSTRSVLRRLGFYAKDCDPMRTQPAGATKTEYHHGGLFIYRLLRPLTVGYVLEQETFFADLLIEPNMVDLLRFNHAAFEMLTGERIGEMLNGEPAGDASEVGAGDVLSFRMNSCWDPEPERTTDGRVAPYQRIRASYLRTAAAGLVVDDDSRPGSGRRCMGHHEFLHRWEQPDNKDYEKLHADLQPVKVALDRFRPWESPVFWLRLVGYAYVCRWFVDSVREDAARERTGIMGQRSPGVRYAEVDLPLADMLTKARAGLDDDIQGMSAKFDEIIEQAL